MNIDSSIFKSYDVRGLYPTSLNEELAYKFGLAYAALIKKENPGKQLSLAVGYDMRLSSPSLKENLIRGLIDSGCNVVDIGLVSTPTFYFAVSFYGYDGGVQVSASHNPKEYNGFKLVRAGAKPISGDKGIYEIRDMIIKNELSLSEIKGTVTVKANVLEDEVTEQSKNIDTAAIKPFKIVVDAANSMGALDSEAILKKTKCELIKMNFDLDGNFPVHQADPLDEANLAFVQKGVLENKADLGISIDGDADRYFFVDEKGEVVRQEILRGIMAQIALAENPGATVCYDIRPGKITKDMIEEVGGKAVVTKVGHSLIKDKMLEVDAVFGGESSGHYFYKMAYGTFEAPTILVLKLLLFLSRQDKPFSEVVKPLKKYFHSGEVNLKIEDKAGTIQKVKDKYADGKVIELDGLTIEYPDFWFNLRASNTESLLRLSVEAVSPEILATKKEELLSVING